MPRISVRNRVVRKKRRRVQNSALLSEAEVTSNAISPCDRSATTSPIPEVDKVETQIEGANDIFDQNHSFPLENIGGDKCQLGEVSQKEVSSALAIPPFPDTSIETTAPEFHIPAVGENVQMNSSDTVFHIQSSSASANICQEKQQLEVVEPSEDCLNGDHTTPPRFIPLVSEKDLDCSTANSSPSSLSTGALLMEAVQWVSPFLPRHCIPLPTDVGLNILFLSKGEEKTVQRRLFVTFKGEVQISVHAKPVPHYMKEEIVSKGSVQVELRHESLKCFVDRLNELIKELRAYEICSGADDSKCEGMWQNSDGMVTDSNPFLEDRYEKTCRSTLCSVLVPVRKWRCSSCENVLHLFRKRRKGLADANPSTRNDYLTQSQLLQKVDGQQRTIKNLKINLDRQAKKFAQQLHQHGVDLDKSLSESLQEILKESKLTPLQALFIQQQHKAASLGNKCGMRWHPTLIRWALNVKMISSAAYDALSSSDMVVLPSDRTLYDYAHVAPSKEGCHTHRIESIAKEVAALPYKYQKYHALMFDEMHISSKLVYQKSSGEMVGYVKLEEVEQEMIALEQFVSGNTTEETTPHATKVLTFLVKGVASSIKRVVASYSVATLTKEKLYHCAWEVVTCLERSGVEVVAMICDGSSVNRAFIRMHTPLTKTQSNVIFDTIHLCDPDRVLYFISDVAHLLKTIRNCFAASGSGPKNKRLMIKKKEQVIWKTIIKLYFDERRKNFRGTYKLSTQNVFLNSYSCMKVKYAAEVMSNTVAEALKIRKWPNTQETIIFIKTVNNFFDMLNGANSYQGVRANHPLLYSYRSINDERFEMLEEILTYFDDWKKEVESKKNLKKDEKKRRLLSAQTLEGIEMSVRGFGGAVKFLLNNGVRYVNARVFSQDHLEQYFSTQRASLGGSSNPNMQQYLATDNKIFVHKQLGHRKRASGNTEMAMEEMQINDEPLPKRKRLHGKSV